MSDLPPFVGMSRKLLVDGLIDEFDRVHESGESRWVSLEAPSGWGKTRVGKRFYARLAEERQPAPKYWPATLGEHSRNERKAVIPRGERESGSLPRYLWWGVMCSGDKNFQEPALRQSLDELVSHGQFASIACEQSRPVGEKAIQRLKNQAWNFTKAGLSETASQTAAALGVALPGSGLAVLAFKKALGSIQDARSKRATVAASSELGASSRGLVEDLVNELSEMGKSGLPVVMFVEDVHFADEQLLTALDAMLHRVARLLVVTTTWPGMIDDSPQLVKLALELEDRVVRVRHHEPAGTPFPEGAGLMELEARDCEEIVRFHYPNAEAGTVALLVNRYQNPSALDLVCRRRKFKKDFGESGALRLSPEEVEKLPRTTQELYRAYWNDLPEELRLQFAVAAVISPAGINSGEGAGHHTWSAPVLNDVIETLDLFDSADLQRSIDSATDAYGWVTHVDDFLRRWTEIDQHHIATNDGDVLLYDQLDDAREAILAALAEIVLSGAEPESHAARIIVALRAEGFIADDTPVAKAIAVLLDSLGHDEVLVPERIGLYERYLGLDLDGIDTQTDLDVRFNGIDAIAESGRHAQAVVAYQDIHERTQEALGTGHHLTVRALYHLAKNLMDGGQDIEAVAAFERAHAASVAALGDDHPDTNAACIGLAQAFEYVGQNAEAVELFEQVLASRAKLLGDDHPDTLAARKLLAEALETAGRGPEAITMLEQVLADRIRLLGDDDPDTLSARLALAQTLNATGRAEALDMIEQVLAERARILGSDHPDTWSARNSLAEALGQSGRWDQSSSVFEQALDEHLRVLGPDHPDAISARFRLAEEIVGNDREYEQLELFERVVSDRTRVLGADHPETLRARGRLGVHHSVIALRDDAPDDSYETALGIFEQLHADSVRVFGADHPETLDALSRVARTLSHMGRYDDALAEYERAVAESIRVLGEGHYETFRWRELMTETLEKAGRADEALALWRQLVEDHVRILGEEHPGVLELLGTLVIVLEHRGEFDEAVSISEHRLARTIEIYGRDHPETRGAGNMLSGALTEAGRFGEALEISQRVHSESVRLLGEDHEVTLNQHRAVGVALMDAGRLDEALAVLELVYGKCVENLGEDSFTTDMARSGLTSARSRHSGAESG